VIFMVSTFEWGRVTGDIEKFSAKENLRKILKVSHFCLGFFLNKTIMQLNILKGFH